MALPTTPIHQLILIQLGQGEKRLLALVVGVRKSLGKSESIKGDLSVMVKAALRKLVANKEVTDVEGVYALASAEKEEPVAAAAGKSNSRR